VGEKAEQGIFQVEYIVLGLVVLAIISIGVEPTGNETENLEVTHISGTISLSTQSSLEAFGLGEFDPYADAEVELDSSGVISDGCVTCVTPPVGIHINGTVNISNLTGGGPGLGYVEGTLDLVYLREFVSDGFIGREWLTVDWGAGDQSRHWEIFMLHNPPRWSPDNRDLAAFVPIDGGKESRTGPWLFVDVMIDQSLNVQGCLPDSSRCVGSPSSDIKLEATRNIASPLKSIQHPPEWVQIEVISTNNNSPTIMSDIRGLMELGEPVNSSPWCHETGQEIVAFQSWNVSANNGIVISPMSTWLDALTLPSTSFTPEGGTWSEIDTANNLGCAALLNDDGILSLGVSFQT
jgi:hypothetical protein